MHGSTGGSGAQPSAFGFSSQGSVGGFGVGSATSPGLGSGSGFGSGPGFGPGSGWSPPPSPLSQSPTSPPLSSPPSPVSPLPLLLISPPHPDSKVAETTLRIRNVVVGTND